MISFPVVEGQEKGAGKRSIALTIKRPKSDIGVISAGEIQGEP
jgi:hypothetical protein